MVERMAGGDSYMPMSTEEKQRFEQEERAYWQQRDELVKQYRGQWVAIVGGQVVAVGDHSGEVIRQAHQKTGSRVGYVAHVGYEDVVYRIRQVTVGHYEHSYDPPMPRVVASVHHLIDAASIDVEFVVDTGANLTILRNAIADAVGLWDSAWRTAKIAGMGATPESRQLYAATIRLADHDIAVEVDCRKDLDEDILGRDVINEFALTVCAKRDQVEFEWVEDTQP
jgi:predicted aspartyl protease